MNKTLLATLLLVILGSPVIAADRPYMHTGIIDAIYPAENRAVGYNLERTTANNVTITEFWLLDSVPIDESANDD